MLPFRQVLFPVDFSEQCNAMAPQVREITQRFHASLILLHAIDTAPAVLGSMEGAGAVPLPVIDYSEALEHGRAHLGRFAREFFPGASVQNFVVEGEPGGAVIEALRRHGADLVMMPTHGHGAIRRFLLGSVTAKVLHDASCAIWTSGPGMTGPQPPGYRHVLCALTLDAEETGAVLRAAASLAQTYAAELTLLHVLEPPAASWEVDYGPFLKALREAAGQAMERVRSEAKVTAPGEIAEGRPADEIRRTAIERGADLIVTGRGHAQAGITRAWSQLYPIIREAPCPVLSV